MFPSLTELSVSSFDEEFKGGTFLKNKLSFDPNSCFRFDDIVSMKLLSKGNDIITGEGIILLYILILIIYNKGMKSS